MPHRCRRAVLALALACLWPAAAAAQEDITALDDNVARTVGRNDGTATVEVDGTYAGELAFQVFGITWGNVECSPLPSGSATATPAANAEGKWICPVAGWASFRVVATAWTSGTASVRVGFGPGGGAGGAAAAASGEVDITAVGGNAVTTSVPVECVVGCDATSVALADDADFVDGTTPSLPVGGVAESASPTTVTEGDHGAFAMTLSRALKTSLYNPSGTSAFGTAGTAATPVLTVQGIASMTPILATVSATNLDVQIGGSDSLTVGTFPDNEPFNVAQINGVTPLMGAGNTGTGSPRVTEAADSQLSAGVGATGDAAATAGSTGSITAKLRLMTSQLDAIQTAIQTLDNAISGSGINISQVGGAAPAAAICDDPAKVLFANINEGAATGNTQHVALDGSDLIYVCAIKLQAGGASLVQLIYGTGTACATGETDIDTFEAFAAGEGYVESGGGSPLFVVPAGNALCSERGSSVTLRGRITYVQQP